MKKETRLELVLVLRKSTAKRYTNKQVQSNMVTVLCTPLVLQGILAFRDFTIRDPRYFVILFMAPNL